MTLLSTSSSTTLTSWTIRRESPCLLPKASTIAVTSASPPKRMCGVGGCYADFEERSVGLGESIISGLGPPHDLWLIGHQNCDMLEFGAFPCKNFSLASGASHPMLNAIVAYVVGKGRC